MACLEKKKKERNWESYTLILLKFLSKKPPPKPLTDTLSHIIGTAEEQISEVEAGIGVRGTTHQEGNQHL